MLACPYATFNPSASFLIYDNNGRGNDVTVKRVATVSRHFGSLNRLLPCSVIFNILLDVNLALVSGNYTLHCSIFQVGRNV